MKKTLQINLGGITFNIEETAYQKLNLYLDSIQKYFASYEGSSEIVADIESRIAEKFFLKTEQGGIIEDDDVAKIIASMGTVDDFEAVKEDDDLVKETPIDQEKFAEEKNQSKEIPLTSKPKSKIFRDGKRKALGGVLAGLANHFEIDVVWFRILFIILAFGSLQSGLGLGFIIAYIIAWIAIPEKMDLEDNTKVKKFYRNPENKVLGGVATGLSSYLGIDLVIMRILFVVTGFFVIGIFIYLVFWIVAPNAITITQKMELKGEPVTIENIESNIKLQSQGSLKEESSISKLLLFPFRILGIIIGTLGKILKPLGSLVKIFAGLILLILGGSMAFATMIATGVFFGVFQDGLWIHTNGLIGMFTKDIPMIGGFFAFLALFVPAAAIVVIGLSLLTGQRHGNKNFWLTALMLWFAGIVGVSTIGSQYALNFAKKGGYEEKTILSMPSNMLFLDVNDIGIYDDKDDFGNVNVRLETSEDGSLNLRKRFTSQGITKEKANEYARMMTFKVSQQDSIIRFDENITFNGKRVFRGQHVETVLEIPKNKRFKMSENFARRVLTDWWKVSDDYDISRSDLNKFTFVMSDNDKIECLECPKLTEEERDAVRNSDENEIQFDSEDFDNLGEHSKKFDLEKFDKIDFGASFITTIQYGEKQTVEIFGDNQMDLNDINAKVSNGKLKIEYNDPFRDHDDKINIKIVIPRISELNQSGASKSKILGFENVGDLKINISGASKSALNIKGSNIEIDGGGASQIICKGDAKNLSLQLSGSSKYFGKEFTIDKARVNASGASIANMGKVTDLKSEVSGGSLVNHE